MNFLISTLGHCAILNLMAIGLTELGLSCPETWFYVISIWAFVPICTYLFKSIQLANSGIVEDRSIRLNRLKGMGKILFFLLFLMLIPFNEFLDENYKFIVCKLGWGLSVDMGIYLALVHVYVFFRTIWIIRVNGGFRKKSHQKES